MKLAKLTSALFWALALCLLHACGGSDGDAPTAPSTFRGFSSFTVGGTVSNLSGGQLKLRNGTEELTIIASGSFTFATKLENGAGYSVSVSQQPSGQTCSVNRGSISTAAIASVTNVQVTCSSLSSAYTIGGSISGLVGQITLINGGDPSSAKTFSSSGAFQFAQTFAQGTAVAVSVQTQPAGQLCTVQNPINPTVLLFANNSGVTVVCANNSATFTLSGTVSNLPSGKTVTLINNADGNQALTISANGSFTMPQRIASGSSYNVGVAIQPTGNQFCGVNNGAGSNVLANVTNLAVTCITYGGTAPAPLALTPTSTVTHLALKDTSGNPTTVNSGFEPIATDGTYIYVVNRNIANVQRINIATGVVSVLAGSTSNPAAAGTTADDGIGAAAKFSPIFGVTTDGNYVYVAERASTGGRLRKIDPNTGEVTTVVSAIPDGMRPMTTDGTFLYAGSNTGTIYKVSIATGQLTSVAPVDSNGASAGHQNKGLTIVGNYVYFPIQDGAGGLYKTNITTGLTTLVWGGIAGPATSSNIVGPALSTFLDVSGQVINNITSDTQYIYLADYSRCAVRKLDLTTNVVSLVAGTYDLSGANTPVNGVAPCGNTDGPALSGARFGGAGMVAVTTDGTRLFVMDGANNSIRVIQP